MRHDLAGKVALVTGGSRGIGAAVARALAGAGADVAITYLSSRQAAENVAAELRATGVRARAIRADQADPAVAAAVVGEVAGEFGRLDIVVNNAAVAVLGPVDSPASDDAALDRQLRVNYTSIVAAIRAAARVLPEGGRIINIGSGVATRTGAAGVADHAGTKAALAGFTRGAARDLAPRGITVNLLQAGLVATQLNTGEGSAAPRLIASVALGRMGRPEEIAAGVLFLASPGASYVTGATLDIDGGYFPRLLDDIAFDTGNRVLVLTGTGDSFISDIDGPSLGDLTKPMAADVLYTEGRRGLQRLADLEIPVIAAVNGPATVHSEYALLADVVIASDTTVFADMPHLAFAIAPGDGLFVVWEEVLGLNRARYLEITQGSFTAQQALSWGAVANVVPLDQVLPQARELAEQMTQRPHLTSKYIAVVFRQRISRRLAEGMLTGMALESLTAANLAYLPQG